MWAYLVVTNFFRSLQGGCKAVSSARSFAYLRIRRADHPHPAPPPALVDRTGAPPRRGRVRPGDASAAAVGRHLSVGSPGKGGGPQYRPAFSHADNAGARTSLDAGVVGLRVTQA